MAEFQAKVVLEKNQMFACTETLTVSFLRRGLE